jgi:hypothetical protein
MNLRTFLSCGYALLVEAHQAVGADLVTAIERVQESLFGVDAGPSEHVPSESENDRALTQLSQMMMGVG